MNKLELSNYNFPITMLGGQDFNWDYIDDNYFGHTQSSIIQIRPGGKYILWQTYPNKDDFDLLSSYLGLDENYSQVMKSINIDEYTNKAIQAFPNLRILRQEFDQTVLNFISSTNRSIDLIRQSRVKLSELLGRDIRIDGQKMYLFPTTEDIANAPLNVLREAKMGYRASYIQESAKVLLENNLGEKIQNMNEEEARESLMKLRGIGPKVADCILAYSLKFPNVTPLDVWGKRVMVDLYRLDPKFSYEQMRQWYKGYFNGQAAYAGQFLFEYLRSVR